MQDAFFATYHIRATADEISARAEGVALEQSVELPRAAVRDPHIVENILARVESIRTIGDDLYEVVIRLARATTGDNPAQWLNMLFGNTSLQSDVLLVDVAMPDDQVAAFVGPQFGSAGLRALVDGYDRPLTCTALKPQGLSAAQLAEFCRTFARAGIDFIKDDHGLANQHYSLFAERVARCQAAVAEAADETGHRARYVPNLIGGPRAIAEQVRICRDLGVQAVMIEPMLVGLPLLHELVADGLGMAVMAHPAFAGALRIAPELLFGKIFRLFGADAVIYPNYGGRFSYSQQTCLDLAHNLRRPWGAHKDALPVPAGGMQVDRVQEMIDVYGNDTILLIGGSLYMAGDALYERSRTFVENVRKGAKP
ncbi:MAG TPA: ribulose 1,5-bisphosphate carboxylase [Chloroflexi bacterium]|nr:ribulose 1,5-bisphosphate carboxylase [Chloroflexota bacterium]